MTLTKHLDILYHLWRERGTLGMPTYITHRFSRLFRRRVLKQKTIVKSVHGQLMELDLFDEGISRELLHCDVRERETLWVLQRVLRQGMTILDVGANIGYYVLLEANLVGPRGFIYAVEPAQANVERLTRNVRLNGLLDRVEVLNMGISNQRGMQKLYLSEQCNLHTFCPVDEKSEDDHSPTSGAATMPVAMTTITDLAASLPRPIDLVRMDIEGFEVEALQGMVGLLSTGRARPGILFEAHQQTYREPDHSMRDALLHLAEYGYSPHFVASTRHASTRSEFARRGYRPVEVLWTGADHRGIYARLHMRDLIDLLGEGSSVRMVYLAAVTSDPG